MIDQPNALDQAQPRVVYDPEGTYAIVTSSEGEYVTLRCLERTPFATYEPTGATWSDVTASTLEEAPLRSVGSGYVHVDDLEDRPTIVASAQLADFIVPDHPNDAFVRGTDAYARSTHAAVRAFDEARPTDPGAKRYKRTVEAIEARARAAMDEERFARGESA